MFDSLKFQLYSNTACIHFCDAGGAVLDSLVLRCATAAKLKYFSDFAHFIKDIKIKDLKDQIAPDIFSEGDIKPNTKRLKLVKTAGLRSDWGAVAWCYIPLLISIEEARADKHGYELFVKPTDPIQGRLVLYDEKGEVNKTYKMDWSDLEYIGQVTDVGSESPDKMIMDF